MSGVRETILDSIVAGIRTIGKGITSAAYMRSRPAEEQTVPLVSIRVGRESSTTLGSKRYKAELHLYVITNQTLTSIESLIEGIKDYADTAVIANMLELLYVSHETVYIGNVAEQEEHAEVKIILSLLYKGTNTDTLANAHPSTTLEGYMSIGHYKEYAIITSGSTTFQALGTNVYDSHKNVNIDIPAGSGSISVDIAESNVLPNTPGVSFNDRCDDNEVVISIRGHFATDVQNSEIMPFMYRIVNEVRSNVNLGDSYSVYTGEPFSILYDQTFEESGTTGSELIFTVHRYWEYSQT